MARPLDGVGTTRGKTRQIATARRGPGWAHYVQDVDVVPVPEPSALASLVAGIGLLAALGPPASC